MKRMIAFLLSISLITGQVGVTVLADDELFMSDEKEVFEEVAFSEEVEETEEAEKAEVEEESFVEEGDELIEDDFAFEDSFFFEPEEDTLPELSDYYGEEEIISDYTVTEQPSYSLETIYLDSEEQHFTNKDDTSDNDSLFDDYIQNMIDASVEKPEPKRRFLVGSTLSENDRAVYDILKERAQQIALGEENSAIITITTEDLINKNIYCGPWTASELGVKSIVADGTITQEAVNAVSAKASYSISNVMNALLKDCPLDLYWYDKTEGVSTSGGISISASYDGEYMLSFSSEWTIEMAVSYDYGQGNTVNSERIDTVKNAIQTAQTVVDTTSGSVLERIVAYKEYICDNVEYDDTAAENTQTPYGDPWQLINVFDNDPDTNVVCEGYSKAFKYLFDLSHFSDSYDCLLVDGNMGCVGETAVGHMWNIVRMDDGRNYLVDVTNCDEGMIGEPNLLFMAYAPSGNWDSYYFTLDGDDLQYTYSEKTLLAFSEDQLTLSSTAYEEETLTTDTDGYYLVSSYAQFKEAYLLDQQEIKIRLQNDITMADEENYNLSLVGASFSTEERDIYIDFNNYAVINTGNLQKSIELRTADTIYVKNANNASISQYNEVLLFTASFDGDPSFVNEVSLDDGEFSHKYIVEKYPAMVTVNDSSFYVKSVQNISDVVELEGEQSFTVDILQDIDANLTLAKPSNYTNEFLTINFNFNGYNADSIPSYIVMNGVILVTDREANAVDEFLDPIEGRNEDGHWFYANNKTVPITFHPNGGSYWNGEETVVGYEALGTQITHYPTVDPPTGKTLAGWSLTQNGAPLEDYTVTGEVTLYAVWETAKPEVTIEWRIDGEKNDGQVEFDGTAHVVSAYILSPSEYEGTVIEPGGDYTGTEAGTYTATIDEYDIVSGGTSYSWSITPKKLAVTASMEAIPYGAADPTSSLDRNDLMFLGQNTETKEYDVLPSDPTFGVANFDADDITGTPAFSTNYSQYDDVGEYYIDVDSSALSSKNYTIVENQRASFNVRPAQVTIEADNKVVDKSATAMPSLTVSFKDTVSGSGESAAAEHDYAENVFTVTPTMDVYFPQVVGAYEIKVAVNNVYFTGEERTYEELIAGGRAVNFVFTFKNGVYTVNESSRVVTLHGNGAYFEKYALVNDEWTYVPDVPEYEQTLGLGGKLKTYRGLIQPEGKVFIGWSEDGHELLEYDDGYLVPDGATDLYAVWENASARVNGYNYLEFEDAVYNAILNDQVITLLADVEYEMPKDKVIHVDKNGFELTVSSREGGYLVKEEQDPSTGIYTYSIIEDETMPRFKTHKLNLSGEIGVGFRVAFPDGFDPEGCYVSFVAGDGRRGRMQYADAREIQDSSDRWFMFYINALELADSITATLHYGNRESVVNSYSAMEYIYTAKNNPGLTEKQKALVNALEEYGYYLQRSGWTDGKEHASIEETENTLTKDDIDRAKSGVSEMNISKELGTSGIESVMFSLTLNAQTKINVSVKAGNDVEITSTNCKPVIIGGKTYYQFTSECIGAGNLGAFYETQVETNSGTAVIYVSPMSYVKSVLNGSSFSDEKKLAMTAFYDYYVAAANYQ